MGSIITALFILITSSQAFGYFSLMDTGELKNEGDYRILTEGQVLLDEPKGFNLNARFATGIDDDSELQFEGGVGSIDYYLGAFWKWVPFPDTDEQPAIGLRAGVTFAEVNDYSTYGFNITPLISKRFDTGWGEFSPYSGILVGLQKNTFDTFFSMQWAFGVQWSPNEWDFRELRDFNFLIEYAFEIDDSFDYLSFGASYDF